MSSTVAGAVTLQGRVLWALCLREMIGKKGKSRLGYFWQVVKVGFSVGVFWWIRAVMEVPTPRVLPLPLFLLMGFFVWFLFSETVAMVMQAVQTNQALLTFPQITMLDLHASSALVVWFTEILVLLLYLGLVDVLGYTFHLFAPIRMFLCVIGLCSFSFGVGLVLYVLALYFPVVEKLTPMVLRVMFFVSGVFFSPSQLGLRYNSYLFYNPVTNFIELMRGVFIQPQVSHLIREDVVIVSSVLFLVLGLLLERYVRNRPIEL
ncbi:MAG: ABC transporter permease [Desulfovibrio sp.]|jgi:capsular polysaccharide transport system permease protein|nr:ABC transporter permease [Desulfovibrio sp.]